MTIRTWYRNLSRHAWLSLVGRSIAASVVGLGGVAACQSTTDAGGGGTPTIAWRVPTASSTGATPTSYWLGIPALDGSRVYFEDGNSLVALDAATGAFAWVRPVRHAAAPAAAKLLVRDGRLFMAEVDSIMAVSTADGHTLWNVHPQFQPLAVPALDATTLYVGEFDTPLVVALDAGTGASRWSVNVGAAWPYGGQVRGLTLGADTLYVSAVRFANALHGITDGALIAISASDGHELWRLETQGGSHGYLDAPIVSDTRVVVNDEAGLAAVGFDRFHPAEVWRASAPMNGPTGGAALSNGLVIVPMGYGSVLAADLITGEVKWRRDVGSTPSGVGVCGNYAFVTSGKAYRFLLPGGELAGRLDDPSSVPYSSQPVGDGVRVYLSGPGVITAVSCTQ
jgi:outer membrane protein assembly factor BamB